MHDRLRLTHAKTADEVQLELLAPWYTGAFPCSLIGNFTAALAIITASCIVF